MLFLFLDISGDFNNNIYSKKVLFLIDIGFLLLLLSDFMFRIRIEFGFEVNEEKLGVVKREEELLFLIFVLVFVGG